MRFEPVGATGAQFIFKVYGQGKPFLLYRSGRVAEALAKPHDQAFLDRILTRVRIDNASGCWLWQGSTVNFGYGQISTKRGQSPMRTHAAMWFALYGERPSKDGLFVCHSCDVPGCCNPEHLWVGTAAQNNADRDQKGRHPHVNMTHCFRGHEFTPENSILNKTSGARTCRICYNAFFRRRNEAKRIAEGRSRRADLLTPEIKLEVYRLRSQGLSAPKIATLLRITKAQIHYLNHARKRRDKKRAKDAELRRAKV